MARASRLWQAARLVGGAAGRLLVRALALRRGARQPALGPGPGGRRAHAGRTLVRRRKAELRREPAAPSRRSSGHDRLERGRDAAHAELCGAVRARRAAGRSPEGGRRRPRRSGRRGHAAHSRDHHRHAGCHRARRDLVVLLARFRRPGRARPLRPDRAQGADHRRRLPLQRQADRRARQDRRDRGAAAEPAAHRHGAVPGCRGGPGAACAARCSSRTIGSPGRRSISPNCRSTTRSTSSIPPAPPACPRRSCTAPAARCCSTSRN